MMMHMPWVLVTLMAFLILVAGGAFVAFRILGARQSNTDHPRPGPQ